MRFWIQKNNKIDFYYSDDNDKETCELCLSKEISGICTKKRLAMKKTKDKDSYFFCFEGNTPKKQAEHIAKITLKALQSVTRAAQQINKKISSIEAISYHNSKKMIASIGQKLDTFISKDTLRKQTNKIAIISEIIKSNTDAISRDLLNVRKTIDQIETEYNLIETINLDSPFRRNDLTKVKSHTLVVTSFYLYEEDFKSSQLYVDIHQSEQEILIEFGAAKSAISQIFTNAIKYCKTNTRIDVFFSENQNYHIIKFEMISLHFTEDESNTLSLASTRGQHASHIKGDGIGLYAVSKYMELHQGYMEMKSHLATIHNKNGKPYSTNNFYLYFPK